MVNSLGTPCYNTKLVDILIKKLKFKIVFKHVKQGVFVLDVLHGYKCMLQDGW